MGSHVSALVPLIAPEDLLGQRCSALTERSTSFSIIEGGVYKEDETVVNPSITFAPLLL